MKFKNIVRRVSSILKLNKDDNIKKEFDDNHKKPVEDIDHIPIDHVDKDSDIKDS